jgi:hypothetical protein
MRLVNLVVIGKPSPAIIAPVLALARRVDQHLLVDAARYASSGFASENFAGLFRG